MVRVVEVVPHEPVRVASYLGDQAAVAVLHPPLDLLWREGVNRVAGYDGVTQAGGLGVEAGRAVAAAEDAPGQVRIAQGEHAPVLLEGPAPGDDLVQLDGHLASPLPSGTAPAPQRRSSAQPRNSRMRMIRRHFTPPPDLATFTPPADR